MNTEAASRTRAWAIVPWIVAAILLVVTWFVVASAPTYDDELAPFEVATSVGEWGTGRNITARVLDVHFSDQVSDGVWQAEGNWLVFTIEAAAVLNEASFDWATLDVAGATYQASERSIQTMYRQRLIAGIPAAGSIIFELPSEVTEGTAELKLGLDADPTLDSLIVTAIDLDSLERAASTELPGPDWTGS